MNRTALLLALLCTGCAVVRDFRGRSDEEVQSDYAKERLAPAPLDDLGPTTALVFTPPREMTVRVLADAEYQHLPDWQRRVERLVEGASGVLTRQVGVQLRLTSTGVWNRQAPATSLVAMLDETSRIDAEPLADLTVFVTAAERLLTPNLHDLGMAALLQPRFVLRDIADDEEKAELSGVLAKRPRAEVLSLVLRRARHKQTVVFVHEWAHAFGVSHQKSPSSFLCDRYDREQRVFGPEAEGVLAQTLPVALDRTLPPADRAARLREVTRAYLVAHPEGDWVAGDRAQLLAFLQTNGAPPVDMPEPPPEPAKTAPGQSPAETSYEKARRLARDGNWGGAFELLRPLAETRPDDLGLQTAACEAGVQVAEKADRTAWMYCERAAALEPKDPWPVLTLAVAAHRARASDDSLRYAEQARARLEAGAGTPQDWKQLARVFQVLDAPTRALAAFAKTGEPVPEEVLDWERRLRRLACLAPTAAAHGVGPEREGEYVATMRRLLPSRDAKAIEAGMVSFAQSPGRQALRCQVAADRGQYALARELCEKALAQHSECLAAHAALGFASLQSGTLPLAKRHLRTALDLDPSNAGVWQALAQTYLKLGDSQGLAELQARHQRATKGARKK